MSTDTLARPHARRVGRHLIRTQIRGLEVLLALGMGVVAIIGVILHLTVGLDQGIWSFAIQFLRWYALAMGIYCTAVYLPIYVAHGRTRREVATGSLAFALTLAPWLTAAVLLGYAIEAGVYHLLGWGAMLPDPHPLGSLGATATTIAVQAPTFLAWIAIGALAGAAFYRDVRLGIALLLPGLLLVGTSATLLQAEDLTLVPIVGDLFSADPGTAVTVIVNLAIAAVASAGAWLVVRDLPLRNHTG